MKNNLLHLFCFLFVVLLTQPTKGQDSISNKLPIINVSVGLVNYIGDISTVENSELVYNPTFGLQVGGQYVFWKTLGVDLHGFYGITSLEKTASRVQHNFRTLMIGAGLDVSFHFANGFMMKEGSKLSPFFFAGVMPFAYYPRGDYKDANGDYYYYWTDGSIRNIDQRSPAADLATLSSRDYNYESSYRGTARHAAQFSELAFSVNGGMGSKFYVNEWLSAQVKLAYHITNTDYLDGYKGGVATDGFFFGSFGFDVNPNVLAAKWSKSDSAEEEKDVVDIDVDDFLSLDSDGDGIPDLSDKCSGTLPGTKVNEEGCSETPREIDPSDIDSMAMMPDSLVVLRETLCENYPILCGESDFEYPEVNERSRRKKVKAKKEKEVKLTNDSMLEIVQIADSNNDGKVDLPELYEAIEQFFDENEKLSLPDLRKLIDYFFEQY